MSKDSQFEDEFDPEIRQFVSYLLGKVGESAGAEPVSLSERREIAEKVRLPLTLGGPKIDNTCDYRVPFGSYEVRIRVMNTEPGKHVPALVYLHGGGWMLFSLDTHDRIMRELAAGADIAVVGVEYSRSPDARYPVQINEVQAVIRWLCENDVGVDGNRLLIGGDSAGANLSVATCLAQKSAPGKKELRGMLLYYGVYDGRFDTSSYLRYADPAYVLSRAEMQEFWESYIRYPDDLNDPLVSPLRADLTGLPPAFLVIAEHDVLHDENIEMATRLEACGVEVQAEVYRGTTHSFLEALSMAGVSRRALSDSIQWLKIRLMRIDGNG